jgi:stearoyl-CoA desaturase (Delta-9 desaturase)
MLLKWIEKKNYQIRLLQGFFLLVTIFGLILAPWQWIIIGTIFYVFLETLGGNIALHRYFGHRSFKTSDNWQKILRLLSHYIGVGSIMSWVGQHRYHHLHSDTDIDVHSPRHQGIWQILFGIWHVKIERSMIKDVLKDKELSWWHHNYWRFHILLIAFYLTIDLLFGTYFLFAAYAFPNLLCLISGYVLAIVTHYHGYKTYNIGDEATNSWIANIYTLGEGWHNNHHAFPNKLRQGEKWWEWDLPAFIIERFIAI